jgi:hypothetical protein
LLVEAPAMRFRKLAVLLAVCWSLVLDAETARAQNLGHKLPGVIGLDAGRIPEPGLYIVNRTVEYEANELRDRNGNLIPIEKFAMNALSNATGISYTLNLGRGALSLTTTAAFPLARLSVNVSDRPEASFDRFGLSDIYIQPARLGWRKSQFDLVSSYAIYLPTGLFSLAGGTVSAGQVTHEFSAGGTIYADANKRAFLTALASYDLNLRKRGVDITRGDTIQVQGGLGADFLNRRVEAGLAGNYLLQVRPDRGADLPAVLQGGRDRVYSLGPEVAVFLSSIHSQIRVRYEWEFGVESRPKGNVLSAGIDFRVRE